MIKSPLTPEALREEYTTNFESCKINEAHKPEISVITERIEKGKAVYQSVGSALNIPWYFIGVIHMMECGGKFNLHLHNGDLLTSRTVHVPKDRPLGGNPPFSWEESAIDALAYEGFQNKPDWSLPVMLFRLEAYNGFGYRKTGIEIWTPYLWSYTSLYEKGKYGSDRNYDPNLVSKQCGTAAMLKGLLENGKITRDELYGLQIPAVPVEVVKLSTGDKATVAVESLNIREGPAIEYKPVISPLARNKEVTIKDEKGEWYQVETSVTGWVRKDFIKRKA